MKITLTIIIGTLFLISLVGAEEINITDWENVVADLDETIREVANCSEQLEICVEVYNELFIDFQNGTNCGAAFIQLKDLNKQLGTERDNCEEELEKRKDYKIGFYILSIVLILVAITLFFYSPKNR